MQYITVYRNAGVHFMRLFPRAFKSSFSPSAASSFPGNLFPDIFFHRLRTKSVSSRRSALNRERLPILSDDVKYTNSHKIHFVPKCSANGFHQKHGAFPLPSGSDRRGGCCKGNRSHHPFARLTSIFSNCSNFLFQLFRVNDSDDDLSGSVN